jgi:hypothetical protein
MDDTTRGLDADDMSGSEGMGGAQATGASSTRRTQPARGASSGSSRSTKGKRASAQDTGLDRETDNRTRELQAEISETREEMSETVEAIQQKLRPSNLMSEGTEAVKTAATERVRDMADTVTDTASRFVENTRQNPWPALLIGAGFTWLLIDRTRDGRSVGSRYPSRTYRGTSASDYEARGWRFGGARSDMGGVSTDMTDNDEWSRDREFSTTSTFNRGMRDTGGSLRSTTRSAQTGLQRMLRENPLLVAAAAVLTGAAVGGALPQTEKENELMGEARDQMIDRAQTAAREAADSVRDVAGAVQHVASQVTNPSGQ